MPPWRCVQHCHYCITPNGPDECAQLKCASFCAAREGADCMRIDDTGLRTVSLIPAALPLTCGFGEPSSSHDNFEGTMQLCATLHWRRGLRQDWI